MTSQAGQASSQASQTSSPTLPLPSSPKISPAQDVEDSYSIFTSGPEYCSNARFTSEHANGASPAFTAIHSEAGCVIDSHPAQQTEHPSSSYPYQKRTLDPEAAEFVPGAPNHNLKITSSRLNHSAAEFVPGCQEHVARCRESSSLFDGWASEFIPGAREHITRSPPSSRLNGAAAEFLPNTPELIAPSGLSRLNRSASEFVPGAQEHITRHPPPRVKDSTSGSIHSPQPLVAPCPPSRLDRSATEFVPGVREHVIKPPPSRLNGSAPEFVPSTAQGHVVKHPPSPLNGSVPEFIPQMAAHTVPSSTLAATLALASSSVSFPNGRPSSSGSWSPSPNAAAFVPGQSCWSPYNFHAQEDFDAEAFYWEAREAQAEEDEEEVGWPAYYRQGFYFPTEDNVDPNVPDVFCPFRCLGTFPLNVVERQTHNQTEWIFRQRQAFVMDWNDKSCNRETHQSCSDEARIYEGDQAYRAISNEYVERYVHHFNFFGRPVYTKSATTPAATLAILKASPRRLAMKYANTPNLRVPAIMKSATSLLDPVVYYGSTDLLDRLKGTALENAVIGRCTKVHSEFGGWSWDTWSPDEDCPVVDHLDPNAYHQSWTFANGCAGGCFPSRVDILAAGTRENEDVDRARKAACLARIERGPVKSRLGASCIFRRDLQEESPIVSAVVAPVAAPATLSREDFRRRCEEVMPSSTNWADDDDEDEEDEDKAEDQAKDEIENSREEFRRRWEELMPSSTNWADDDEDEEGVEDKAEAKAKNEHDEEQEGKDQVEDETEDEPVPSSTSTSQGGSLSSTTTPEGSEGSEEEEKDIVGEVVQPVIDAQEGPLEPTPSPESSSPPASSCDQWPAFSGVWCPSSPVAASPAPTFERTRAGQGRVSKAAGVDLQLSVVVAEAQLERISGASTILHSSKAKAGGKRWWKKRLASVKRLFVANRTVEDRALEV